MAKHLKRLLSDERGAIAMYFALLTPVFLVIGAIVIDLSRYYSFNTQLQNYADAAALAGATELNRLPGARAKALEAARNTLINTQDFAEDGPQISLAAGECPTTGALPDQGCVYFLWRLPANDTDPIDHDVPNNPKDNSTDLAFDDSDARYIEVRINRRKMSDIMINAVLSPNEKLETGVVAVAGNNDVICNIPGFFMCNPVEQPGDPIVTDPDDPDFNPLKGVEFSAFLKSNGSAQYLPGDWGLLCPLGSGNCNSNDASQLLATTGGLCISVDNATTKPGVQPQDVIAGVNVRFDYYTNQAFTPGGPDWKNAAGFQPAFNVTQGNNRTTVGNGGRRCEYADVPVMNPVPPATPTFFPSNRAGLPRGGCFGPDNACAASVRQGIADWAANEYFRINHACQYSAPVTTDECKPAGWDALTGSDGVGNDLQDWTNGNLPSRYSVYRWEIESGATQYTNIVKPNQTIYSRTAPYADSGLRTMEEGFYGDDGAAPADTADCYNGPSSVVDNVDFYSDPDVSNNINVLGDRRILVVALVNCNAMEAAGIKANGRFNFTPGAFALHFITEPMRDSPSTTTMYTEWLGVVSPELKEEIIKRIVQLYRRDPNLM